ncbi:hypothetical protein N657DRAFT_681680 [Parathielavia appendiculata]|uniref:Uncharacterized protein n=1 Tax=Parathielavia appendiculata TaxID=2587402 RepID=A0AAN6TXX1_9PEZI|nr:hypothetical protein N657DRAFT_681680 [Parathielavia appendiculata]
MGLGASYSLDKDGHWVALPHNSYGRADLLNVGSNDFDHPDPVFIFVGVQTSGTKEWSPIRIKPLPLRKDAHGEFQPLEEINIPYVQGDIDQTEIVCDPWGSVGRTMRRGGRL